MQKTCFTIMGISHQFVQQDRQLEFDVNQVMLNGKTALIGFSAMVTLANGTYNVNKGTASSPRPAWVGKSGTHCDPRSWSHDKWHHVQASFSRNSSGTVTYHAIWLDGIEIPMNVMRLSPQTSDGHQSSIPSSKSTESGAGLLLPTWTTLQFRCGSEIVKTAEGLYSNLRRFFASFSCSLIPIASAFLSFEIQPFHFKNCERGKLRQRKPPLIIYDSDIWQRVLHRVELSRATCDLNHRHLPRANRIF